MLISTLILTFAPILIWSQSASNPSRSSYLPTQSPSQSPPSSSQTSTHSPSTYTSHPNDSLCPSPTPRSSCGTDNTQSRPSKTGRPSRTSESIVTSLSEHRPTSISLLDKTSSSQALPDKPSSSPALPDKTSSSSDKTSSSPGMKIGAGISIGLGILILVAVALAILLFRRRQNHNKRSFVAEGLKCEAKPSFEENSAKSSTVRSEVISSQDLLWLGDGRDISPETRSLPLTGPRLNTTIPLKNEIKSSSASKLITDSTSSRGPLNDADSAFKFLDQSAAVAIPSTLAKESRSPVSPEVSPLGYFSNVPPSPEKTLPPNTSQKHPSVDSDPSPLAKKNSREFFLPILPQELKDVATRFASSSIILNSPQSTTPEVKPTGERAHLRDYPHPLRSNSSASRGTLADLPNHGEPSIGNNTPGSNSTPGRSTTVNDSSLDAKDDSAAIQNFSRKIGSLRSRQVREVYGPPAVHSHLDNRL